MQSFKSLLLAASPTTHIAKSATNPSNWVTIDTNGDGEIQQSEASAIGSLELFNIYSSFPQTFSSIQSLEGIKAFNNATYFSLGKMYNLTGVDVSNLTNLKMLSLYEAPNATFVNTSGCSAITNLNVTKTAVSSLDTSSLPLLRILYCDDNNLQSLNLSNNNLIEVLKCDQNNLTALNVSNLMQLMSLNLSSNNVTNLNLSNLPKLQVLVCSANGMNSLNLLNSPMLKSIEANVNNLTSVNLSQNPAINYLRITDNQLTSIDLSNLPLLQTLALYNNQLTTLSINNNTLLNSFNVSNNNLQTLFMKNGRNNSVNYSNNPNISYICCDDSEINQIINTNNSYGYNATINSYCSFTPGGTFYTIQGNTKYDSNNNGCDINDVNKPFQKFTITGATNTGSIIANNSGNYSISVSSGSHTIVPIVENPAYFTISPTSFTANFPFQTSPLSQNFCITANGTHNDLEVIIIPVNLARPGFEAKYRIVYKNKGTTAQSGTLNFNFNDNLMNLLISTTPPNSQSTGVLNWNFTNLQPFETREITLTFTLNTPTQTPPLSGGDILNYTSQVTGATDETPSDNLFTLNQLVVNSYDPNDKTCLEGTSITHSKVGDFVHYMIRFENTGTANAQNIVVTDEIDLSKYEISTLAPLHSSHAFVTKVTGNKVEFIFQDIQLPFDDANNDGYVTFKIKTKSTLNIGESFSNLAKIYFDYNHPIITNNYTTTVQNILSTAENSIEKNSMSIYPNPVKDILNIKSKNEISKAEIYDSAGRIILSAKVNGNAINVSELSKGSYIIKIFVKDQYEILKFIKH